ncbi:polyprenyl synthetase family protein [candidate division WOR-3 bacterium]|nr:polyprenyl synthetase family protein [candidate division WOR-3 bacterium]
MTEFETELRLIRDNICNRIASTQTKDIFDISTGGKMLRSILTVLVYDELSYDSDSMTNTKALDLACCAEIVHALTLAADDIIDQDDMRRGKPSLYSLKGFSMAFLEILSGLSVPYSIISRYGPEYVDAVAKTQRVMCSGVAHEITKDLPASTLYNAIISRKTGSLFALAARFGAMAADAPEDDVNEMVRFGLQLGNTYQIQDDIRDLIDVITGEKTADPITGTEFMMLKCLQVDDLTKQLIKDILNGNIEPAKARSLLHKSGILNALVRKRDAEKKRALGMVRHRSARMRRYVEHCIPESFL